LEEILLLRKKIDEIDEQILHFLRERVDASKEIGTIKRKHGIPIRDRRRQSEVHAHVRKRSSELGLNPLEVKAIYQGIIAMCVNVQETDAASERKHGRVGAEDKLAV